MTLHKGGDLHTMLVRYQLWQKAYGDGKQGPVSWRPTTVKWRQFSQSNRHSTIGTRQTEYHEALPSSANMQSPLTSSFAVDGNASWYSVCLVPMAERRLDCEHCRHLTVVELHDTGPRVHSRPKSAGLLAVNPMEGITLLIFIKLIDTKRNVHVYFRNVYVKGHGCVDSWNWVTCVCVEKGGGCCRCSRSSFCLVICYCFLVARLVASHTARYYNK